VGAEVVAREKAAAVREAWVKAEGAVVGVVMEGVGRVEKGKAGEVLVALGKAVWVGEG
jgi:hypothetical protein